MKSVLIAGGGVIGLTTAYYLHEAGYDVTVIDNFDFLTNCSTGNAGLIVPSHFIPLAAPGMTGKALRWALDPKGPFSVRLNAGPGLWKWGFRFWKSSTVNHVLKAAPVLCQINNLSRQLYKALPPEIETKYRESGLLMVYRSAETEHEEGKAATMARSLGVDARVLKAADIERLYPGAGLDVRGGVFYPGDACIHPGTYVKSLIAYLSANKVKLLDNHELTSFKVENGYVRQVVTSKCMLESDEIVIASGALSQKLFHKLKADILIQPGKGYSFVSNTTPAINVPLILLEARVAVTPYDTFTRFAGLMEIAGKTNTINHRRVQGMKEAIHQFMPEAAFEGSHAEALWTGQRPCSVDGLPYIGRLKNYRNVTIATGHSMMGVSLAPITGKLVEEIISEKKTSVSLEPFLPER